MERFTNVAIIFLFSVFQPVTLKYLHIKEGCDNDKDCFFEILHNLQLSIENDRQYYNRFPRHVEMETKPMGFLSRVLQMLQKSSKNHIQGDKKETRKLLGKSTNPFISKVVQKLEQRLGNGKKERKCKKCRQRHKDLKNIEAVASRIGNAKATSKKHESGEEVLAK